MLFNSFAFLLFFPTVCLVYFVLPRRWRQPWLLAASYYFYMCQAKRYALVLAGITLLSWWGARLVHKAQGRARRGLLAAGVCTCLAPLLLCKYAGGLPGTGIVMPVGLSFYTLAALGYLFDVHRGKAQPEPKLWRYALFLGFFPTLLSGPIERSDTLLAQLQADHPFEADRVRDGLCLMLWGYFEKLVIADQAAVLVNAIFTGYPLYGGTLRLLSVILYAFQLYADFAGYSHLALGAAQVLGFTLTENFRQPYLALSVREFWGRWHVSLSNWLRDYIYIPLGGSRRGLARRCANLLAVFAVSALWHGTGWQFLVWGGLHALYQIAAVLWSKWRQAPPQRPVFTVRWVKRLWTFALIDLAWLFFRVPSLADAGAYLRGILTYQDPWTLTDGTLLSLGLDGWQLFVLFCALGVLLAVDLAHEHGLRLRQAVARQPLVLRWAIYYAAIAAVLVFGVWGPAYNAAAFLYFKF